MNKKGESIIYYFKLLTKPSGRRCQKKDTFEKIELWLQGLFTKFLKFEDRVDVSMPGNTE